MSVRPWNSDSPCSSSCNGGGAFFISRYKEVERLAKNKYEQWISAEGLLRIEGWARDGMIDTQIAEKMGISTKTLYEWKKKYESINLALRRGKEVVDRMVENALLKSALGYDYEETEYYETKRGTTKRTYVKHMPPNVTAIIYWLKNRKPAEWRDRPIDKSTEAEKAHSDLVSAIKAIKDDD